MVIVLLYFIVSIYLGRKNPLYYLILPFALEQGQTAFIDQSITLGGKNLLSAYTTIFVDVLFFLTTFVVILLIRPRYKSIPFICSTVINLFFIYLLLLWIFSFLLNYKTGEVFFYWPSVFLYSLKLLPVDHHFWIGYKGTI